MAPPAVACHSDSWLRFPMPVGPFSEPRGTDCYFSPLGFDVFSGFILVFGVMVLALNLIEAFGQNPSRSVRALYAANSILCVTSLLFVLSGLFFPTQGFALWALVAASVILVAAFDSILLMNTAGTILATTARTTMVEFLGGQGRIIFGCLLYLFASVVLLTGACGAAVLINSDVNTAFAFWQAFCVGAVLFTASVSLVFFAAFNSLANLIQKTIEREKAMQLISGVEHFNEMSDLEKRLRRGAVNMLGVVVFNTIIYILHTFVLPVFWWIALIQALSLFVAVFSTWWAFTPPSRRRKFFFFIPSNSQMSVMSVPKSGSRGPIAVKPGAPPPPPLSGEEEG